ncbi:MAG: hypothetical protein NVSMB46_09600 [Candidatus Saccharimonadales bacterium]
MANTLGQLNCAANTKNTGFSACFEDFKQIIGAFLFDAPRTFTALEISTLSATLTKTATTDTKSTRAFPIHNFLTVADASEKVITESFDYGAKAIVRDGDIDWTFQFVDGGNCLNAALRTHNGKRWALFYDKENKLLGYNNANQLSAIPLQFFLAHPWTIASGTKTAAYMIQFVFLPKYINENRAFVKADFDLSNIVGLQDIDIIVKTWNQATGVANVTLQTTCGAVNIYDLYNLQLAASSFTAADPNGNNIRISTMAGVASSKTFNIGFNKLDFPAGVSTLTLSGAAVSVLTAQLIIGYEIGTVNIALTGS